MDDIYPPKRAIMFLVLTVHHMIVLFLETKQELLVTHLDNKNIYPGKKNTNGSTHRDEG